MSDNLESMFPQARLDAMRAHARDFGKKDLRADGEPELLGCFLPGKGGGFRQDGAESYFVARQLEHIRAGVIEMDFPPMKYESLVPMNTEPSPGAEEYTVTHEEMVGRAKISKDMQGIIPRVDAKTTQTTFSIYSMLLSYGYSLQEARAAMQAGRPLPARRAAVCREQMERELNTIAFLGQSEAGIKGMLNLASTLTYTTATGAGGSKNWDLKTPEEILADWNGSVSQVITNSNEVETPDTSVLPLSRYEYVSTKRMGDGTSDTILTYFKRNNPHIKTVESSHLSESNTGWTGKRMVNYQRSPLKVELIVPVPFEQLMPDVTSTQTVTICHLRTAGVVAHRPKSVIYTDEI